MNSAYFNDSFGMPAIKNDNDNGKAEYGIASVAIAKAN